MQINNKESQRNMNSTPPFIESVPPEEVFSLYEEGSQMINRHRAYDLRINEIQPMINRYIQEAFMNGIENALYHAIGTAYYMGIAKGVRMQKRHPKQ